MDLEYFPHFFRAINPHIKSATNEELKEIGAEFKWYLENKLKDRADLLAAITDISPATVIKGMGHPFKIKGYSPVLVLHFTEFVKDYIENERARNKT